MPTVATLVTPAAMLDDDVPATVYGGSETLEAIQKHLFNMVSCAEITLQFDALNA